MTKHRVPCRYARFEDGVLVNYPPGSIVVDMDPVMVRRTNAAPVGPTGGDISTGHVVGPANAEALSGFIAGLTVSKIRHWAASITDIDVLEAAHVAEGKGKQRIGALTALVDRIDALYDEAEAEQADLDLIESTVEVEIDPNDLVED